MEGATGAILWCQIGGTLCYILMNAPSFYPGLVTTRNMGSIKGADGQRWASRLAQTVTALPPSTRPLLVNMASSLKTLLVCSVLTFASVHATQRSHPRQLASAPVVTVTNGSYEGLTSSEYGQDFFLGMRYAEVCA